jgi:hypothetical protein
MRGQFCPSKRALEPLDLVTQLPERVPSPFEVLRASRLFKLRGDAPRRRRANGRNGSLETVCRPPQRLRITCLERPIDSAQRRWIVRSKELDDLFEEPAIASGVRERGGLVEDRRVRLLPADR